MTDFPSSTGTKEALHYLGAIKVRLELLYEHSTQDARLLEHLSDEVDWVDAKIERLRTLDVAQPPAKPVAWRVEGLRRGAIQTWYYWKPEWPTMHEEHGDKVTPLYEAPQPASNALSEILKHVRAPNRPSSERLDRIEEICTAEEAGAAAYTWLDLLKYANHLNDCRYRGGHDCDCGLDEIRADARALEVK